MPKISVIIPVFGVEANIGRCARSLFEQNLEDMEFIFVDDCSTDNSIKVLQTVMDDYPKRKGQVTIMRHEANKGIAQARKTGIQGARGDYIIHCDSDDWVDADMYRAMFDKAQEADADVVVCDYVVHDGMNAIKTVRGCNSKDINKFQENLLFQRDPWSLCNKLFKRTAYYKQIIYPAGDMGEDMVLTLQLINECASVAYVSRGYYYYRCNNSSTTRTLSEEKILKNHFQAIENVKIIEKVYAQKGGNKRVKSALNVIKWGQNTILFPIIRNKEYYKLWRKSYPGLERQILFDSNCDIRIRIKCLLTLLHVYPWRDYKKIK